jgi:cysteine dioxygenase
MLTAPKILKGTLKESLYETPPEGSLSPPRLVKEAHYAENQVTHISDHIGIHKISNPSATELAVSLHLYTPPYAANFGFHVFDEATGEPRHITQANLTSNRGVKLEK